MTGIAFASAFAVAAAMSAAADLAPLVKLVGTGDDVAEPVDSIRFEMLREGIEDYEYFAMLRKVDPESALLSVPREITSSLDDYSTDPAGMEAYRVRLAEAIERSTLQNINKSNRRMKP